MSEENKDTIITQFQDITGQDIEKSKFYLESSGWNLEIALGSFYETEAIDNFEEAQPQNEPQNLSEAKAVEEPKTNLAPEGASSMNNHKGPGNFIY